MPRSDAVKYGSVYTNAKHAEARMDGLLPNAVSTLGVRGRWKKREQQGHPREKTNNNNAEYKATKPRFANFCVLARASRPTKLVGTDSSDDTRRRNQRQ